VSLFFNRTCIGFISHCLKLLNIEGYSDEKLNFEKYQIIQKILGDILSFYPKLKIYEVDPHPKAKYIGGGHTMEKED